MVFAGLFARRTVGAGGRALYASAAAQARNPELYRHMGIADTVEGRFEAFTLHVALLVLRLKGQGEAAAEASQDLFETYVQSLDDALRELGVGDVVVPKRMRKLGEAFYGRTRAYEQALAERPDTKQLSALVERTLLEGVGRGRPEELATYVGEAADLLARTSLDELLAGRAAWPEPAS
jgi:cytochrome b pre-mRNA-processing protein 3